MRERDVLADGHAEDQALRLAILGDEGNARGDRCGDVAWGQRRAVDADFAAIPRIGARNSAHDLGSARADEAGERDDLARAHGEADVVDDRGTRKT